MRLHPRTQIVQRAEAEINEAVSRAWEVHDLTSLELCQILNARQAQVMKYMLRTERHPGNPDKGGDEA